VKGAYVFSGVARMFDVFAGVLTEAGGSRSDDVAQHIDAEGRALTVFSHHAEDDADVMEPPSEYRGRRPSLPLSELNCCVVECRWEDVFIGWMHVLSEILRAPIWILDGDGVLWDQGTAESGSVRL